MKKGEALSRNCTVKDKKEGVNGRVVKFMGAIAYGRRFIKCYHYTASIDGETCKAFIKEHFPLMFENSPNPNGKLFFQYGDPSHNSALARKKMDNVR